MWKNGTKYQCDNLFSKDIQPLHTELSAGTHTAEGEILQRLA
jgi:hypothetical protein